jgi:5'-deoxynucleotidase
MTCHFYALLRRMRYIRRWSLMKNSEQENVQEHSHEVAVLAHLLALVRQKKFSDGRICPDPARVALKALYHDAAEIMTGDLPTPVKYFDESIRNSYARIEKAAADHLLGMVPDFLQDDYSALLSAGKDETDKAEDELIKAADRLSALIKCTVEIQSGNLEFRQAAETVKARLDELDLPEVRWFCKTVLPSFELSLD